MQPVAKSGPLLCAWPSAARAASGGMQANLTLSQEMMSRMSHHLLDDIDLMVCDMAGTTVQEGGLVYQILQQSIQDDGLAVSDADFHPWHGAKKEQVIEHFVRQNGGDDTDVIEKTVVRIGDVFLARIEKAYFAADSPVSLIDPGLLGYMKRLQGAQVKVALDTGYPPEVQVPLVKGLGLDKVVDSYISSYQVAEGRPYPYMIFQLMERCGIQSVKRVCKVGDSCRDMEMGRNAGCGLVVGVLSGADSAEELLQAGAHVIAGKVTDLPVPIRRAKGIRLPDLS